MCVCVDPADEADHCSGTSHWSKEGRIQWWEADHRHSSTCRRWTQGTSYPGIFRPVQWRFYFQYLAQLKLINTVQWSSHDKSTQDFPVPHKRRCLQHMTNHKHGQVYWQQSGKFYKLRASYNIKITDCVNARHIKIIERYALLLDMCLFLKQFLKQICHLHCITKGSQEIFSRRLSELLSLHTHESHYIIVVFITVVDSV